MFVNISYISGAHNSKSKCCYNVELSVYYLYVEANISIDFQIYIGVPLRISSVNVTKSAGCLFSGSSD